MVNIGGTFVRFEAHFNQVVPNTTVSQYLADMGAGCPGGSTCDPNSWTWNGPNDTDGQITEQLSANPAVTLMLIAGGFPNWLSSNGGPSGSPTDFNVYNDIQKKYFQHFNNIRAVPFVEIWPEPNTDGITPSQYATVYQQA